MELAVESEDIFARQHSNPRTAPAQEDLTKPSNRSIAAGTSNGVRPSSGAALSRCPPHPANPGVAVLSHDAAPEDGRTPLLTRCRRLQMRFEFAARFDRIPPCRHLILFQK